MKHLSLVLLRPKRVANKTHNEGMLVESVKSQQHKRNHMSAQSREIKQLDY